MVTGAKINRGKSWLSVVCGKGSFSSRTSPLNGQSGLDIRRLVHSLSHDGSELVADARESRAYRLSVVTEESFLKGEGGSICLTQILNSPLPTLSVYTSICHANLISNAFVHLLGKRQVR